MTSVNSQILQFFTENYKPGIIGLIGTKDAVGQAIREAQRKITADGKESKWSHCFVLGDLRFDRRGDKGQISVSPYIFESDLRLKISRPQLRNGAQENWLGKWCCKTVEYAAIIDLDLTDDERDLVIATALQRVDEQVLYPIQELLGTWLAIITDRLWKINPLDNPNAMYCSSFVRHCYKEAGRDFLDISIDISNTTPEHIAQVGIKKNAIKLYTP